MQADTILKFGSLALGVAQDEKIRELATMIHKGAKRRGMFGPQMLPPPSGPSNPKPSVPASSAKPSANTGANAVSGASRVPFAPFASSAPAGNAELPAFPSLQKLFTVDNAKKALAVAGSVKDLLMK